MCDLCEGKGLDYAKIKNGWLYMSDDAFPEAVFTFPVHFCPWCGKKQKDERMMPKITPRDWKYQMQEQEAENDTL